MTNDRSTKSFKIFYASCVSYNRLTDDKDNLKMDTQLWERYDLEIQMYKE